MILGGKNENCDSYSVLLIHGDCRNLSVFVPHLILVYSAGSIRLICIPLMDPAYAKENALVDLTRMAMRTGTDFVGAITQADRPRTLVDWFKRLGKLS